MRPPLDGSTALVTGASSGIGEAFSRQLAPRAKKLILVARRKDRLDQLAAELRSLHAGLEVIVEPCDLTDRAALTALCDRVERAHGGVDILINNAGLGDIGMFDWASWSKTERLLETNVRALTYLTHRFARGMVDRRRGGILNVSSGFGLEFLPGFAAYVGSKHFVTGFTEGLRLELAPMGVVVTQLCPGPVATEFERVAGNFTGKRPQKIVEITADHCARAALSGFERGRAMVIPGFLFRLAILAGALTPRPLKRLLFRPGATWLRQRQAASRSAN